VYKLKSLALALVLAGGCARGQEAKHPVTGRPIAPTMSVEGADWLDRPEREREEQPHRAIEALHLHSGMNVGEVGAGTGYYALRIAKLIAPGTFYANELQPEMLVLLKKKAVVQGVRNIQTVIGTQDTTNLPAGTLDYVLMVDVYHELSHPQAILQSVRASLKPGGLLVLLEFRKEDPKVPIRAEHEMTVKDVKAELAPERFTLDHLVETLPWQHMLFFRVEQ
jgi:ubiquinone/menaquinone biosynthesis C-methylase UbiE